MTKQLKSLYTDLFHANSGTNFPLNEFVEIDEDRLNTFIDSQMEAWLVSTSSGQMQYYDGTKTWDPSEAAWDKFSNPADEIDYRAESNEPTGYPIQNGSFCDSNNITFDDATRTFTIAPLPGADCFEYMCWGKRYIQKDPVSIQIPDVEGQWFIYFVHETLTVSQTPWSFGNHQVFTSIIQWDWTNKQSILFLEERHGHIMPWAVHQNMHYTDRSKIRQFNFQLTDFILNGDGSLDSHAQVGITGGYLHDEDIVMHITNRASPTNPFEQILSPIGRFPIYYRIWEPTLGMNVWRKRDATNFPVYYDGVNPAYYNHYDSITGRWSLQPAPNGYYVCSWPTISNNIWEPVIAILGQAASSSLIDANNDNLRQDLDIGAFGSPEYFLKYRLIYRTDTSYINTPKAVLVTYNDVDQEPPIVTGVVPPFVFSRQGTSNAGSYLATGTVTTDQAGQPIKGLNFAVEIKATNKSVLNNPVRVQFQRRTGASTFVDIPDLYVDLPAGGYTGTRTGISIPVGPDWEIACYVKTGNGLSNVVVIIYLTN